MSFRIIEKPRLVAEAIAEVVDDEWQHVVIRRHHAEIGAVLRLLEADELLHAQLLVKHTSAGVSHSQHISVGSILHEVHLNSTTILQGFVGGAEHLTDEIKQRLDKCPILRHPTDSYDVQGVARQMFFQSFPHPRSLLLVGYYHVRIVGKQRQLIALDQQRHLLLVECETVEHGCQQSVEGVIEGIYCHRSFSIYNLSLAKNVDIDTQ